MLKKRYLWKELTSEGRLINPHPIGPYYDEDNFNDVSGAGFSSVEEAEEKLTFLVEKHGRYCMHELVLITEYYFF